MLKIQLPADAGQRSLDAFRAELRQNACFLATQAWKQNVRLYLGKINSLTVAAKTLGGITQGEEFTEEEIVQLEFVLGPRRALNEDVTEMVKQALLQKGYKPEEFENPPPAEVAEQKK